MLAYVVPTDETFLEEIEDSDDCIFQLEQRIDMEQLLEKLNTVVKTKLSPREREVVSHVYGLEGYEKLRPYEVAGKLQISRGTVAYYLKRAFTKLNNSFTKDTHYYEEVV